MSRSAVVRLLAFALSAAVTVSAQAPGPAGTGSIRGRVISTESGNPLRRARVQLSVSAGQSPRTQLAYTDPDGHFEFRQLPAGRYNITASRTGYVALSFGQTQPFEAGQPLELAAGEQAEHVDFALPRGGVITGRITEETGDPLPGVQVNVQRYAYQPDGERHLVRVGGFVVTDDLGQFRAYGLMPGSYVVSATPGRLGAGGASLIPTLLSMRANGASPGSATAGDPAIDSIQTYITTYFPGTRNLGEAQPITVQLNEQATASFPVLMGRLAQISGVVRSSQGQTPPSAFVVLSASTYNSTMNFGGPITGGEGSFTIARVPPGEYTLSARVGGPDGWMRSSAPSADEEFASIPVTIDGQDLSGIEIVTARGTVLTGRVVFDGAAPRPRTSMPLRVSLSAVDPLTRFTSSSGGDNGVVDANGRFRISGAAGRVLFRASAPGWSLRSVMLNGADLTDVPLELTPGMDVNGVQVTLTDRLANLTGTVKDARGAVARHAVVVIYPASLPQGATSARFTRTVRPDQNGRFEIVGPPPGEYLAIAVRSLEQGREWDPAFQQAVRPSARPFRLTDGQTLSLDLILPD